MKTALHILTKENDLLPAEIIARERSLPDCEVVTFDLGKPNPDYAALLENIFTADSVAVW